MYERIQRARAESSGSTPKAAPKATPKIVHDVVRSPGKPLDAPIRAFMEARFGADFGSVRVHDDANARASLDAIDARGYAVGSHVALRDARATRPSELHTLAHELTHVVQQRGAAPADQPALTDDADPAEREADAVAQTIMRGGSPSVAGISAPVAQPAVLREPKTTREPLGPYDRMLVEHARRRRALLKQYVADYATRQSRRERSDAEIKDMREKRAQMDIQGSDVFDQAADVPIRAQEEQRMGALNTAPLKIEVTDKQITFRVRLQVRFENTKHESKFAELKNSIQSAIDTTWNQRLKRGVFGGRDFVVIPEVTPVAASATRDRTAWLITVRSSDKAKVSHPGCALDQPDPDSAPTSVTDPTCDGGVMNLPPAHIARPDIIGHEMMHLFGFIDRYRSVEQPGPDRKMHTRLDPTRATGGRVDLLASGKAPMLTEDLSLLFDELGVYDIEKTRGLDALRQLEREGMRSGEVTAEIHRQEEIITTGRDPDGPQPIKKSFMDKVYDSVDEL